MNEPIQRAVADVESQSLGKARCCYILKDDLQASARADIAINTKPEIVEKNWIAFDGHPSYAYREH